MAPLCDAPDNENLRKINVLIVEKNGILTEALFMFNRKVLMLRVFAHKLSLAQRLQAPRLAMASNDTSGQPALSKAHVSVADGKWYRRRDELYSVHVSQ